MDKWYHYKVAGSAAHNQTWSMKGYVKCEYTDVFTRVNTEVFSGLTHGKAEFGKPGVGCYGPYTIRQFDITLMETE